MTKENYTEVNKIYSTMDYDKFNLIKYNRIINRKHVEDFKQLILTYGYEIAAPIIVDQEFNIIEGQHRFMALKELGYPIYFSFSCKVKYEVEELAAMNSHNKNWTTGDYVKGYAAGGNINYEKILQLSDKLNLDINDTINYMYECRVSGGTPLIKIKDGQFIYTQELEQNALHIMREYKTLQSHIPSAAALKVFNQKAYKNAYLKLRKMDNFKFEQLNKRMAEDQGYSLIPKGGIEDKLNNLIDIYNKHLKNDSRLKK